VNVSGLSHLEWGIEEFRLHWGDWQWPDDASHSAATGTMVPFAPMVALHELGISQAQVYWRNWPDTETPCGICGLARPESGVDPCLGFIPGVLHACCGHGADTLAYFMRSDRHTVWAFDALDWFDVLGIGPKVAA
jgi:hypothetical protein